MHVAQPNAKMESEFQKSITKLSLTYQLDAKLEFGQEKSVKPHKEWDNKEQRMWGRAE